MNSLQVVAVHPTIKAAAKSVHGNFQSISRLLNGAKQRSSYKGYYWRKVGDTSKPRPAADGDAKVSQLRQPVQQICPETGSVIATFDSIAEAESALDIRSYMISKVLNGVQHTTGGFCFRAVGSPQKSKRDMSKRPVHQVDPDNGEIIRSFPSFYQASKAVGVTRSSISSAARGKTKTSAGYCWVIAEKNPVVVEDENSSKR